MPSKNTSSLAFPQMFNIVNNVVSVYSGNRSIVNRTRLLILTDPTELYNNPTQGVGLKKYLWQYNTANTQAIIQSKIKDQLKIHEPCVDAEKTQFADGLMFTGSPDSDNTASRINQLKMTIGLQTIYEDTVSLDINLEEERQKLFSGEE